MDALNCNTINQNTTLDNTKDEEWVVVDSALEVVQQTTKQIVRQLTVAQLKASFELVQTHGLEGLSLTEHGFHAPSKTSGLMHMVDMVSSLVSGKIAPSGNTEEALSYMLQEVYKDPLLMTSVKKGAFQEKLPDALKTALNETIENVEKLIQEMDLTTNVVVPTGFCGIVIKVDDSGNAMATLKIFEHLDDLVKFKHCQYECFAKALYAQYGIRSLGMLKNTPFDIEEIRFAIGKIAVNLSESKIMTARISDDMVFEVAKILAMQNAAVAALFVLSKSQKLTSEQRFAVACIAMKSNSATTLLYINNYMLTDEEIAAVKTQ